jgi:hypothetical protein
MNNRAFVITILSSLSPMCSANLYAYYCVPLMATVGGFRWSVIILPGLKYGKRSAWYKFDVGLWSR